MDENLQKSVENTEIDIESQPPYKKYPAFKDWIFRLILFVVGFLVLDIITVIIQLFVMAANPAFVDEKSDLYITGLTMINSIRYLIIIFVFVVLLFPRLKVIALKFKNWKTDLIGLGAGFVLIGATILYSFVISQFVELEVNQNEVAAEQMIKSFPILSVLILGILGPISEEITYRYGLFGCLKKKSIILAYILAILVFGIIHFDFTGNMQTELLNLPSYLIAGAILTFVYHKFGFNASIIAHIVNNLYAILVTLIAR